MNGVLADMILGSFLAYSLLVVYTVVLVYITYHLLNLLFGGKKQNINTHFEGILTNNINQQPVITKEKRKIIDRNMWIVTIVGTIVISFIFYMFMGL